MPKGKGYESSSTKTTDDHETFSFANDLFNKTLARVAGRQEINTETTHATIYE
ncbi:hypothetical protein [Aestuariivirga sp.]|uniref:hypothetical protein n=1 Tax=Aestuariivirga sp. TaxID=2650926 RepID=UPI003782F4E1